MSSHDDIFKRLADAVVAEDADLCSTLVKEALNSGVSPSDIILKGLCPGLVIVGEKYEKGEYFMTDLMLAAEVMNVAMEILRPHLKSGKVKYTSTLVIGTVEGDIHDIGKNLVAIMFESAGFRVIDLGVDVPSEKFVEAAKEYNANVVGASAILGPCKFRFEEINNKLKEAKIRDKVIYIVGGWGTTQEWAEKCGADAFGEDMLDALKKVEELMKAHKKS